MDNPIVIYGVVFAIAIAAIAIFLIIFSGFVQWALGISDIIRLLEEQNAILKSQQSPESPQAPQSPPRNPLTGK